MRMSIKFRFLITARFLRLVGVDLFAVKKLRNILRYLRSRREYLRMGGVIDEEHIVLSDYDDESGSAHGHYFHQDLLVARRIFEENPVEHLDIGSRIDGFVAHVAAFRDIDVVDIRPLENRCHKSINFMQADLMNLQADLVERYSSVSCLHALEHFGLGRYSDPVDPNGHVRGFHSISKLLKPGGKLYISVPVGVPKVAFNAHRVLSPWDLLHFADGDFDLERFDYVDDNGDLICDANVIDAENLRYGCGIYTFVKKPHRTSNSAGVMADPIP